MYFFLSMLSISETCYTVAIIPCMLSGLLSPHQTISLQGCATQLFFYLTFGINNCFLLTAMGYDRYMAICNPLLYRSKMSRTVCAHLLSVTYIYGFSVSLICTTAQPDTRRPEAGDEALIKHWVLWPTPCGAEMK